MKDFLRIAWLVMWNTLRHPFKDQLIVRNVKTGRIGVIDGRAEWTAMHERHAAIGWRCLKCPARTTEDH